jgi:hypothetical protein
MSNNKIRISSTRSPRKFAHEAAMISDFLETGWKKKNSVSGPGKMIEALSDQEREIVKQLKPEHFNNRLFQ